MHTLSSVTWMKQSRSMNASSNSIPTILWFIIIWVRLTSARDNLLKRANRMSVSCRSGKKLMLMFPKSSGRRRLYPVETSDKNPFQSSQLWKGGLPPLAQVIEYHTLHLTMSGVWLIEGAGASHTFLTCEL